MALAFAYAGAQKNGAMLRRLEKAIAFFLEFARCNGRRLVFQQLAARIATVGEIRARHLHLEDMRRFQQRLVADGGETPARRLYIAEYSEELRVGALLPQTARVVLYVGDCFRHGRFIEKKVIDIALGKERRKFAVCTASASVRARRANAEYLPIYLRRPALEAAQGHPERLGHAAFHPQYGMNMLGHDLGCKKLDFRRKFTNAAQMGVDCLAERRERDCGKFRRVARKSAQQRLRTIGENHRYKIHRPAAVIPITAAPPHAMNDVSHDGAGVFVVMPARGQRLTVCTANASAIARRAHAPSFALRPFTVRRYFCVGERGEFGCVISTRPSLSAGAR